MAQKNTNPNKLVIQNSDLSDQEMDCIQDRCLDDAFDVNETKPVMSDKVATTPDPA